MIRTINPNTFDERTINGILQNLAHVGAAPPAGVQPALDRLAHVVTLNPEKAREGSLHDAYLDPKATRKSVEARAAQSVAAQVSQQAWVGAVEVTARAVKTALAAHADDLIEQMRKQAEAAIDEIVWFAEAGAPEVAELLREGRTEDANRASRVPIAFAAFEDLRKARDSAIGKDTLGRGELWKRFAHVVDYRGQSISYGLDYLVKGILDGNGLYWPTVEQSREVDAAAAKAVQEEAEAAAAQRRREFQAAR